MTGKLRGVRFHSLTLIVALGLILGLILFYHLSFIDLLLDPCHQVLFCLGFGFVLSYAFNLIVWEHDPLGYAIKY